MCDYITTDWLVSVFGETHACVLGGRARGEGKGEVKGSAERRGEGRGTGISGRGISGRGIKGRGLSGNKRRREKGGGGE